MTRSTRLATAAFVATMAAIVLYLLPSATVAACCLEARTRKGGERELAPAVAYTYTPAAGTNLWSDPTRWSPSYPGETIAGADTVTINDGGQVFIDVPVNLIGKMTNNSGSGTNGLFIQNGGSLSLDGLQITDATFTNNGRFSTQNFLYKSPTSSTTINNGEMFVDGATLPMFAANFQNNASGVIRFTGNNVPIAGHIFNAAGTVDLENKSATLNGGFAILTGTGRFRIGYNFPVGGSRSVGQLTGNCNQGGQFDFYLMPGSQLPSVGEQYTVINGFADGTFSNSSVNLAPGLYANIYYGRTATTIKIEAASKVIDRFYATGGTQLYYFTTQDTNNYTTLSITGRGSDVFADLAFRPSNGKLYGVTTNGHIYIIDTATGVATPVRLTGFALGGFVGMSFDPVSDQIRVVTSTEQNLRFDPDTGAISIDTSITPAGNIVDIAYDRPDTDPSTPSTLFAMDTSLPSSFFAPTAFMIGGVDGAPSPNGGVATQVVSTLIGASGTNIGFDISPVTGIPYIMVTSSGTPYIYTQALSSAGGQAQLVLRFGTGSPGNTVKFAVAPAAPTASEVSLSGRVTAGKRGITNAVITVTGNSLAQPITVKTGRLGMYTVPGLTAGETYVVTVSARRFFFDQPSRILTLNDNATDIDFSADDGGTADGKTPVAR